MFDVFINDKNKEEIWVDVKGFESYYQVSSFGRVKSLKRIIIKNNGVIYPVKERIIKLAKDKDGYLICSLVKNQVSITYRVNRIVAISFIENPCNKKEVNHINGSKDDNSVKNLEWVSRSENMLHAYKTGLAKASEKQKKAVRKTGLLSVGENHGNCKLKDAEIDEIRRLRKENGLPLKQIADMFSVSVSHVCSICKMKDRTKITIKIIA